MCQEWDGQSRGSTGSADSRKNGPGEITLSSSYLFAAGAGCIRAEALAEQIQLQLKRQFQAGNRRKNTLYTFVDFEQVIQLDAAQFDRLFDFLVLRVQNLGKSFLLFGNGVDQLCDRFAAAVIRAGRCGLRGFHRRFLLSRRIMPLGTAHSMCSSGGLTHFGEFSRPPIQQPSAAHIPFYSKTEISGSIHGISSKPPDRFIPRIVRTISS